jgi:hypothetical protein
MGFTRWSDGVDRRRRLVRAVGVAQGSHSGSTVVVARSGLKRAVSAALLWWGLVSLGFVWCVAGRECDYEWACFSATFFNVTTQ